MNPVVCGACLVILGLRLSWSDPGGAAGGAADGPGSPARNWAILPVGVINPENGLGVGFKFIDRAFLAAGDDLDLLAYGTTKGQAEFKAEHRRRNWLGTAWRTRTLAEAFYYPESWFGGGNHPREADEHVYTPLGLRGEIKLGHPLGAGFLLSGSLAARFLEMTDLATAAGRPPDAAILPPELPGYRGGGDCLAGLSLEFDTRDDERLPSRGWHAGQTAALSPFPADYDYADLETWLAWYAAPHPRWESAFKVQQETALGRAPFYAYPYLGDKRRLRGISGKRLRDRSAQMAQAEIRWGFHLALPVISRFLGSEWQLAGFGGAGRVGEDFGDAWGETLHWAGGVGGRLIVGERLGALRGDLGFSRYGYGLYVDFNQAF